MGQSRNENILENMLGAHNELGKPQSRIEQLLMWLLEQGGGGGEELIILNSEAQTEIPSNGRTLKVLEFPNMPEGYEIKAVRNISVQQGTNGSSEGFKRVIVQCFSTTGGGVKVQIPLINLNDASEKVKLIVNVLAGKS